MDKPRDGSGGSSREAPLTERQRALVTLIQGLDPQYRHTITITCRGTEPWQVERVCEHTTIELKTKRN